MQAVLVGRRYDGFEALELSILHRPELVTLTIKGHDGDSKATDDGSPAAFETSLVSQFLKMAPRESKSYIQQNNPA